MNHDTIMQLARDAAGGMLSHDAEGFCSLTGPEIVRFAELLVKECAGISETYASGSMPLSIALAIKRHFGIE